MFWEDGLYLLLPILETSLYFILGDYSFDYSTVSGLEKFAAKQFSSKSLFEVRSGRLMWFLRKLNRKIQGFEKPMRQLLTFFY